MDTKVRVQYFTKSGEHDLEANYMGLKEAMAAIFEHFWVARNEEKIKLSEYLKRVKIQLVINQS